MVNNDILGALKSAIARGYSIEITRQSLINSGYSLQEIDEAVQFLEGVKPIESQQIKQPAQLIQQPKQQSSQQIQQQPSFIQPIQKQDLPQKDIQKVSAYENVTQKQQKSVKERGSKIFIITLIILLAILLGALIAFLIFKEQLVEMFS